MTAEVQERHRRAAADALKWNPSARKRLGSWFETGELPDLLVWDEAELSDLLAVAQALASLDVDAEERGRIEERARCLAWATLCGGNDIGSIRRGDEAPPYWLDVARKELGE